MPQNLLLLREKCADTLEVKARGPLEAVIGHLREASAGNYGITPIDEHDQFVAPEDFFSIADGGINDDFAELLRIRHSG